MSNNTSSLRQLLCRPLSRRGLVLVTLLVASPQLVGSLFLEATLWQRVVIFACCLLLPALAALPHGPRMAERHPTGLALLVAGTVLATAFVAGSEPMSQLFLTPTLQGVLWITSQDQRRRAPGDEKMV
jgi:hypothetical protein